MRIIICGAGKVGITIASQLLLNSENEVVVIDNNPKFLAEAQNLDLKTIEGLSSSPEVLDSAGAMYADLIICVTQSDEINMLTAHIAGTMFNVERKIARIRGGVYLNKKWSSHIYNPSVLGIDHIISPELEVAKHVANMLYNVGMEDKMPFYRENYHLIAISVNNITIGKTLGEVERRILNLEIEEFSIKFVKRTNTLHFYDKNFVIESGDEIYILCSRRDETEILHRVHGSISGLKNVLICGGGDVGLNIAKLLEDEYYNIKILEIDKNRCEVLADELSRAIVIHGDMHNRDLIKEAGIPDVMINVSGRDDANLFTTLIGRSLGIRECFTLMDDRNYGDILANLNLRNVINTRDITISKILFCISGRHFTMQDVICEGQYSVCEFIVEKKSGIHGLDYHKVEDFDGRILAIVRDDTISMDGFQEGKFMIGDIALVIVPFRNISKLERLIKG